MSGRLNLARALRSKTFDEIIGQELPVRLVKNSLYRDKFFPAYLLAGQRGCGKTTLGRVFAAAINCANIKEFTQRPRDVQVPCLHCASCEAMYTGRHPDFFEIDAASHTGVDHVRSLIESASFMPGLGRKKIYLIDEAHMLSKAAFNAFLKILEEPPPTVIFMLATTDPHKIIETVRSRCFQLYLDPIPPTILADYLKTVCEKEEIAYEPEALYSLAQEAEGSVRDALNRLEQIQLAFGAINLKDLVHMRGEIGYDVMLDLFHLALTGSNTELLQRLKQSEFKQYNALLTWKKGVELLRQLIGLHYGVTDSFFERYQDAMKRITAVVPAKALIDRLERWYRAEPLFAKSRAQHTLIEMLLLRMQYVGASSATGSDNHRTGLSPKTIPPATNTMSNASAGQSTPINKNGPPHTVEAVQKDFQEPPRTKALESSHVLQEPQKEHVLAEESLPKSDQGEASSREQSSSSGHPKWLQLLQLIKATDDPLVYSIFKQGRLDSFNGQGVSMAFSKDVVFFKDLIEQTRLVWQPLLEKVFGTIALNTLFSDTKAPASAPQVPRKQGTATKIVNTLPPNGSVPVNTVLPNGAPVGAAPMNNIPPNGGLRLNGGGPARSWAVKNRRAMPEKKVRVDVRDREAWAKVHGVLRVFPGVVYEV